MMEAINHPAAQPSPPAAISRILSRFTRAELEGFVAVAIDLMDLVDGEADAEDGNDLEDDFTLTEYAKGFGGRGPGCEISDQDAGAWIEWNTMRGSQKRGPNIMAGREDDEDDDAAEDDDPAGGNVEDEGEAIDEREPDYNEDHCQHYGIDQAAPISETNPVIC